eukprot:TRINITY_DN23408_c0_g2_i1.p1 TRINITY_DN23408_c0_g2~~TRINITY_DN23408_c0_g2_i1.p1  ORF type:complete len:118 (+),score=43.88 TRINITY_DN23408_c0_g2_i1:124-477(+)
MIRRPPRSTLSSSSAASDVYKRQHLTDGYAAANVEGLEGAALPQARHITDGFAIAEVEGLKGGALPQSRHVSDAFAAIEVEGAEGAALPQPLSLIHISEPTRLLSISYAVFCLKKKK